MNRNNMKYIKYGFFLCIFGLIMPLYAGNHVIDLSESRIDKYKNIFIAEENLRKKLFYLSSAVAAVGIGGLIYYLFNDSEDSEVSEESKAKKQLKEQLKSYKSLTREQKRYIKRMAALGIAHVNKLDNTKPWYNKLWDYTKTKVPSVAFGLLTHIVWNKALEFIEPALPRTSKIGDKIFAPRSIGWFIEQKTTMQRILQDIMRCLNSKSHIDSQEFRSLVSLFVIQCEKTLAFISYVVDFLSIDQGAEHLRSMTITKTVKKFVNELSQEANRLIDLSSDKISKDDIERDLINKILLGLVDQFESFIAVEMSAGFEDDMPRQIFEMLRIIIQPEFDKASPVPSMGDLADFMKMFGGK